MRPMFRAVLLKSLLVVTLLFAQQGIVAHVISHVLAERSQDQSLPHDRHCDLCELYAQVGSAIGSTSIHFDFTSPFGESFASPSASWHSIAFTAFTARGPPCAA